MTHDIRWGILGPGKIAQKFAAAVGNSSGATLCAVASSSDERAEKFARDFGAPRAYGSYRQLVEDPAVDAIYIATLHSSHLENILLCLEHGKPVLCEKPFTINAAQARQAVDAARRNQVFLMEAMWTRFLPAIRKLREWVLSGEIGEVAMLNASFGFAGKPDPQARHFSPALGGGALLDLGVYSVSFASMMFGQAPEEISSFVHIGNTGVDEESVVMMKYPNNRIASLASSIRSTLPGDAFVAGTKGCLICRQFHKADSIIHRVGQAQQEFHFPYEGGGFEHQIAEVGQCLRESRGESELMPLDESIAVMETMDRIRAMWGLKYPME